METTLFNSSSFERHQRDLQKEPIHAEAGFERPKGLNIQSAWILATFVTSRLVPLANRGEALAESYSHLVRSRLIGLGISQLVGGCARTRGRSLLPQTPARLDGG